MLLEQARQAPAHQWAPGLQDLIRKIHSAGSRVGLSWQDESENARVQPLIKAPTQQRSETQKLLAKNHDF